MGKRGEKEGGSIIDKVRKKEVWGVILAAGLSKRMGTAKMILHYKGSTLIRSVIEQALQSSLNEVVVVVNPEVAGLVNEVRIPGVHKVVANRRAEKGLSTSVQAGLKALPDHVEAALFLLGDQPYITDIEINKVIDRFKNSRNSPIYQSSYFGVRGHPVLFQRKLFGELFHVSGDEGGRSVIKKYDQQVQLVEMGTNHLFDIDTKSDYEKVLSEEVC
ncbi:nucleotidyltransferase family protein [Bacillus sp. N1-1]|uniref:nucleotidyltransferase family protein n=1 Tax=Bacillus sp. N1-1 TaxID=2682541 RepID=UPI00131861D7|nr:nucleotidyltransferase family protein [Bacillus sp. N1-1]QHA93093.1 NTP transferase domain-containing protein [Bacillus sp. N1-1]